MRLALPALVTACLLATACSGGGGSEEPSVSSFHAGPCRQAAPGVLAVRRSVRGLGDGARVPSDTQTALAKAQLQLKPATTGSDPVSTQALLLFQQTGYVRLLAVGNSYDPAKGARLLTALDTFITSCTTPAPAST